MNSIFSQESLESKYSNATKIIKLLENDSRMTWNEFVEAYSDVITTQMIFECFNRYDWEDGERDLYFMTIGDERRTRFAKTMAGVKSMDYDDENVPEPDAISFTMKGVEKTGLLTRTKVYVLTIQNVFTNLEKCYIAHKTTEDKYEIIDVLAKRESSRQLETFGTSPTYYLIRSNKGKTFEELTKKENVLDKIELDTSLIDDKYSFNYSL